ncbi:MAG: sulfur carrier protein ThiS [Salinivirgaceae bacterium]|nr:sulfur carrier protein ThiS [Salinivirgaceae bacterium]MDY0281832.1 sulfur carrier protein ThiS [Salinivirgaceae bacterium]
MKIVLNHNLEEFEQTTMTVQELLDIKAFTFKILGIMLNDVVVKENDYLTTTVKDGDAIIILQLVSGG